MGLGGIGFEGEQGVGKRVQRWDIGLNCEGLGNDKLEAYATRD